MKKTDKQLRSQNPLSDLISHAKDEKNLIRNNYSKIKEQFSKSYTIKNNKTGQIISIKAASALHAANLLKWRIKNVTIIEEN